MDSNRGGSRFTWIRGMLGSVLRFLMCGLGKSGQDQVKHPVQETTPTMQPPLNMSSVRPWF